MTIFYYGFTCSDFVEKKTLYLFIAKATQKTKLSIDRCKVPSYCAYRVAEKWKMPA